MRRPHSLGLLVLLAACAAGASQLRQADFAPRLGVDLERMTRAPSGLYYQDLRAGSGRPVEEGDIVVVRYRGWLPDGTVFESSYDENEAVSFEVGAGTVVEGWDEGVQGMRPGGLRRLVLPPDLAYGRRGSAGGRIPPGSPLVFDIELLEVRER